MQTKSNKFNNHNFKKNLGQNFISDKNLLNAIAVDSKLNKDDLVLEIGAGAGTLSAILADYCKTVVSLEVDEELKPTLTEVQSLCNNLTFVFKDILKLDLNNLDELFKQKVLKYKVVANLPYYITTPILFKLFKDFKRLESITIMVQKEVAERMVAQPKSPNYGALSIMVNYYGNAQITRIVNKQNFYPMPKVNSAIVKIDVNNNLNMDFTIKFETIVKTAFATRRKMLIKNLATANIRNKQTLEEIFNKLNISLNSRAEELSVCDFIKLTSCIYNL